MKNTEKELCPLGKLPDPGNVPKYMYAQVIRRERYGSPEQAIQLEKIKVPEVGDDEVLVGLKTAGLNHNAVWAATGKPLDLIGYMQLRFGAREDFMITGSDGAGIVLQVGKDVTHVNLGDEVVLGALQLGSHDPYVLDDEPLLSSNAIAWGFETNWGSFAQYCLVKEFQCFPRPQNLTWEESASYSLSLGTVYRMLHHYSPNNLQSDDVVLIWGACGGLGVYAMQLVQLAGATAIGVVSSEEKIAYCNSVGVPAINRKNFSHWDQLKGNLLDHEYNNWIREADRFKREVMKLSGGREPTIVLEHPGEQTFPTSVYTCSRLGMIVICAGTSGYHASFDLRYLWMMQKRIQGSHGFSVNDLNRVNTLIQSGKIQPVIAAEYDFLQIPEAVQLMQENKHPPGSVVFRIAE